MPQSSTSSGEPPSDVTASTIVRQSWLRAIPASVAASESAPVEVSAWTNITMRASGWSRSAFSSRSGSTARPHGSSTSRTSPPQRSAIALSRPPKTPFWQTTTLSPGSTRLTTQLSMPAVPGPETGMVSAFEVRNA